MIIPHLKKKRVYFDCEKWSVATKSVTGRVFELTVIESADYPLKVESVQLNDLVLEVLVGFYEEFNRRNIEPTIHIPEQEIIVKADSSAVKRVIENLITNALKHSTGNVTITLRSTLSSVELIISNPASQLKTEDLFSCLTVFIKWINLEREKVQDLVYLLQKA